MNDNEKPREPRWIGRLSRVGRVAESLRGKSKGTFGAASEGKRLMAWSCACGWQGTSRELKAGPEGLACPLCGRRVEGEVITGAQIKAARKLLGWTRAELAVRAFGVSSHTVEGAERARARIAPTDAQLASIQRALEAAGIEFTDGGEPVVGRATTFRYSCGRWAPFHPQGAQPDRSPSDKHQRWLEGLE